MQSGKIQKVSEKFASWVGQSSRELIGQNFRSLFLSTKSWNEIIPKIFIVLISNLFPLSSDSNQSSIGIHFQNISYEHNSVISLSPALAPHDKLKNAFMGDLMNDPRALANTLN